MTVRAPAEHVDAVVVGSGFGGAVAAYRLAAAGLSVVVLERGRRYPPGSFPRSPEEMAGALWDPRSGRYGMYEVHAFRGCNVVVSSGLGGGSLIYASVLLRKDEHWFVDRAPLPGGGYESWPVSRADLDPHYDAVEAMLGATPYPVEVQPYADTPKTHAMRAAADRLGLRFELPRLAVSFAAGPDQPPAPGGALTPPPYGNLHGRPRRTCRMCGECNIGCNDGAKNTLDHTYLSAAAAAGADLRDGHEVRSLRPVEGGGYLVGYLTRGAGRGDAGAAGAGGAGHGGERYGVIGCDRLVLAAGTLGTTGLLLRNRSQFPGLSAALGTRFCANGDLLAFVVNSADPVDGTPHPMRPSRGPVITAAVRLPDSEPGPGGRGGYIQDGGYPGFVDWMLAGADQPATIGRAVRFALAGLLSRVGVGDGEMSGRIGELIDGSFPAGVLPLLGMGHDVPDGVIGLRGNGRLDIDWSARSSRPFYDRLAGTMRTVAAALDGDHVGGAPMPVKRIVTAHPLGGAPMGRHPGAAVCDGFGEVFGWPGLYVADGAALPGPVGANPSLTIAALADRMCDRMLAGPARSAGPHRTGRAAEAAERPSAGRVAGGRGRDRATSLSFTETMRGWFAFEPLVPGEVPARRQPVRLLITVTVDDVDRFIAEPGRTASVDGHLHATALGGRCPLACGEFALFVPTPRPSRRQMDYRLAAWDGAGNPFALVGSKIIEDDPGPDLWRDTSTLTFRLFSGHERGAGEARVFGSGVVRITPAGFAHQLTTLRTSGPNGAAALQRFGRYFAGELWSLYAPAAGRARG